MIVAIDAELPLAEGRVDEFAMMWPRCIRVSEGREMATAYAHALHGYCTRLLEMADHLDQGEQQIFPRAATKCGNGLFSEAFFLMCMFETSKTCSRHSYTHHAFVGRVRLLRDAVLSFQCVDGISRRGLGNADVSGDLSHSKPPSTSCEQIENGQLGRVEAACFCPAPLIDAQDRRQPRKGLVDAAIE